MFTPFNTNGIAPARRGTAPRQHQIDIVSKQLQHQHERTAVHTELRQQVGICRHARRQRNAAQLLVDSPLTFVQRAQGWQVVAIAEFEEPGNGIGHQQQDVVLAVQTRDLCERYRSRTMTSHHFTEKTAPFLGMMTSTSCLSVGYRSSNFCRI
jgi:hypothetical protein